MYYIGADDVKRAFAVTDGGSVETTLRTNNIFALADDLCIGLLEFELPGPI